MKVLDKIQSMFAKFIWAGKRPRTFISILQHKKISGGLGLPNVKLYYHAPLLEAICQWRHVEQNESWIWEQEGITTPVWILSSQDQKIRIVQNEFGTTPLRFWKEVQTSLFPAISPFASFIWHLDFGLALTTLINQYG